jgi:hypothetical protein
MEGRASRTGGRHGLIVQQLLRCEQIYPQNEAIRSTVRQNLFLRETPQ